MNNGGKDLNEQIIPLLRQIHFLLKSQALQFRHAPL